MIEFNLFKIDLKSVGSLTAIPVISFGIFCFYKFRKKVHKTIILESVYLNASIVENVSPYECNGITGIEFSTQGKQYLWGGKYRVKEEGATGEGLSSEEIKMICDLIEKFKENSKPTLDLDAVVGKLFPHLSVSHFHKRIEDKLNK